jgi:glycosyltransferase involved in cell wall biosynthesis
MNRLRLLHIVPSYLPATRYGGPIYSVHGLCKALAAKGHDVSVFTTSVDGPGDSDVPHGSAVEVDGVRVWYFRSKHLRRLYYSPPMHEALGAQISTFQIVHLHSVFLWPTNMASRICHGARVPYVLSPRGMLVPELIAAKNALIKRAWLRLVEAYTVRHAAALHYTSAHERDAAGKVYPVQPPGFLVPNGIDLPDPVPSTAAAEAYGLFLGRVHWSKGLDRLLHALAGTRVRLIIAGNDEDGYASKLRELIRSLQLESCVEIRPPVFGAEKWALIAGARLLVLPSLSENFGNVVLEAMSVGCPVVTTRNVGAAEIVATAEAGVVCGPSAAELRTAILGLWNDTAFRARAASNATVHVARHLTWSQVALRMADRYAQILTDGVSVDQRRSPRAMNSGTG